MNTHTPMAAPAMTPGNLPTFPFSPAVSQALAGSSPHPGLKKSPHSSALAPSLSSSGIHFGSPASSTTGAKYINSLNSLLGVSGDGTGVVGGGEDKERSKLKKVLKVLKSRPGKISEDGIKRVARRAGVQYHTDSSGVVKGVHTLIISGIIVVVDIDFKDGAVSRVALSFAETSGPTAEFSDRAAKILEKTLTPAGFSITSSLAQFADNLERFARSDRLSHLPSLNCFSAVTGLYVSMMKIWEKEVASMGEVEAMCKGMGRPGMHLRGKVGFCIDYWKERRLISSSEGKGKGKGDDESGRYWRVVVDVDELPNESYITPVRNSEDWVSDNVLKGADGLFGADTHEIDWIEPPLNNYEPATKPEVLARLNNTRFIAKLDPPVVISIQDEVEVLNAAGASMMSHALPGPLETVLCPKWKSTKEALKNERTVCTASKDEKSDHTYNLNTLRPAYGRVLEEIPFSHPRHLAIIFQVLRKYACFTTVFHSAFPEDLAVKSAPQSKTDGSADPQKEDTMDIDDFLADEALPKSTPVDISMNTLPLGLSLLFPITPENISQVEVNIMNNADLQILAVTGGIPAHDAEAVKKVVDVTEDLGILVEWIRKKVVDGDAAAAAAGVVAGNGDGMVD
ncbi:hypothetical protein H072_10358 [Dactylellina haptotyla CBS 200.50]|uniref:Mediator of RNA polymerase II transcription subunit 1 n=1 Tax=Dactylellina haptotyla (strain CBS 200.50) TaxID=1284197 RepID=S8A0C2_DACHA|nr:hypothetical protein H072_10358 [Dactylellina haptotyla CBS 200.50]